MDTAIAANPSPGANRSTASFFAKRITDDGRSVNPSEEKY